jgi:hypothetical protein
VSDGLELVSLLSGSRVAYSLSQADNVRAMHCELDGRYRFRTMAYHLGMTTSQQIECPIIDCRYSVTVGEGQPRVSADDLLEGHPEHGMRTVPRSEERTITDV